MACHRVDPNQYPVLKKNLADKGWLLPGSIPSTKQLAATILAQYPNCRQTILINPSAAGVTSALDNVAAEAVSGDLVLFTYVGHGASVALAPKPPAAQGAAPDLGYEVSILLHDRMMVANEYGRLLRKFDDGVRYVSVVDGCGIATFYTEDYAMPLPLPEGTASRDASTPAESAGDGTTAIPVGVSGDIFAKLYAMHKRIYDLYLPDPGPIGVTGIAFAACADGECAWQEPDGSGSFFSLDFCAALEANPQPSTYSALRDDIEARLAIRVVRDRGEPMHPTLTPFGSATAADLARPPLT